MTTSFENPLKRMLREGQKASGAWLQLASPMTAEIMSQAGFDCLIIDMEHGPGDLMTLVAQQQAMNGTGCVPLVRTPWNDFVAVKRILDAGAFGILFPHINTRSDAEAAVRSCKYPPEGIRGVAGSPRAAGYGKNTGDYLARANKQMLIIAAIETTEAVNNLDQIVAVSGIDGIFIGPMDLSTSMGHLGNPAHPDVQAVIETIERKTLRADKILSTFTDDWEQAQICYEKGYQLVTLMADGTALGKLSSDLVGKFKKAYPL